MRRSCIGSRENSGLQEEGLRSKGWEGLKGETETEEAEVCFLKAIEVAQKATSEIPRTACGDELSPACGSNKARKPKLTTCYPKSTIGSPKGLIPRICKRRRRDR